MLPDLGGLPVVQRERVTCPRHRRGPRPERRGQPDRQHALRRHLPGHRDRPRAGARSWRTAHTSRSTPAQLAEARSSLVNQIDSVMTQVAQTAQGQNPRFTCALTDAADGPGPAGLAAGRRSWTSRCSSWPPPGPPGRPGRRRLERRRAPGYLRAAPRRVRHRCFSTRRSSRARRSAAAGAGGIGDALHPGGRSATQSGTHVHRAVAVAGELAGRHLGAQGLAVGKARHRSTSTAATSCSS